jgi:hypothetical protein
MLTVPERIFRRVLNAQGLRSRFLATRVGRMHVLDSAGSGSLPPIVVLHGLSANALCYAGLLQRFAPHCRRVIAPDMPAHGFSDVPTGGLTDQAMVVALARSTRPRPRRDQRARDPRRQLDGWSRRRPLRQRPPRARRRPRPRLPWRRPHARPPVRPASFAPSRSPPTARPSASSTPCSPTAPASSATPSPTASASASPTPSCASSSPASPRSTCSAPKSSAACACPAMLDLGPRRACAPPHALRVLPPPPAHPLRDRRMAKFRPHRLP